MNFFEFFLLTFFLNFFFKFFLNFIFIFFDFELKLDLGHLMSYIRRATYMAWHIQGVAYMGCGIYGGKVPLMPESSLSMNWYDNQEQPNHVKRRVKRD